MLPDVVDSNDNGLPRTMFGHCGGDIWRVDDFTACFKNDYLRTILPLILTAASVLHIIYVFARKARHSKYAHAYSVLEDWRNPWSFRMPSQEQVEEVERREEASEDSDMTNIDDEFARNAQLALHPTLSQVNRTTYLDADKPRGQVTLVCVEFLSVLGEVIVQIVTLMMHADESKHKPAAVASFVSWAYVLVLVSIRLFCTVSKKFSFPTLWYHTAFLYCSNWILTALLFRSSIISPRSKISQDLAIASFALATLLTLIALSSRQGNREVDIEFEGEIPPAREPTASLLSLATFSWVDYVVWVGYNKTVELKDVWNLMPEDKAGAVLANYRQVKKTTALSWHLLRHFKNRLAAQALWAFGSGVLTFIPTLLLREILRYIEDPRDRPRDMAWTYVVLLFVSGACSALADGQALWIGRHMCINLRALVIGEIYAKSLKRKVATSGDKVLGGESTQDVKSSTRKKNFFSRFVDMFKAEKDPSPSDATDPAKKEEEASVTSGTVINLMAVDSFKIAETCAYLHFLWASTPVQLVMSIALLYNTLGFSSIAGIGLMVALLPLNIYISNKFSLIQKRILAATDARIHMTNEVLTNIRIIKFFAWEQRFMANIDEKRKVELKELRYRYLIWTLAGTIWSGAPIMIAFLSFAVYTFGEKKDLVPSVAFTALSLFQLLRIPLDQLADMVAHVLEAKVSVDRVEEFLMEEDTQKYKQLRRTKTPAGAPTIGFVDGTFTWGGKTAESEDESDAFRLMDLNLRFEPGQLNVIAGSTGSGKTSLLMALLGEMIILAGDVYLPGAGSREDLSHDPETGLTESVAYCAQQAWLVNGSVKANILFASTWDRKRYKQVLKACALEKDLEILDNGDETLVGEKGVTLSGGQKQRISLARALYSHARHVLLDDILSAVDSHTAKWIFDEALMGPLMYNRTCILVTHNISLCLPHAYYAVLLDNGKVTIADTAHIVINSGKLSQDLTKSVQSSVAPSRAPSVIAPTDAEDGMASTLSKGSLPAVKDSINETAVADILATEDDAIAKTKLGVMSQSTEENVAVGGVKLSIIFMYLRAMGGWFFWTMAAVLFTGQQVSYVATNVWIRQWANAYIDRRYDLFTLQQQSNETALTGMSAWTSCLTSRYCYLNVPYREYIPSLPMQITGTSEVDAGYYLGIYAVLGIIAVGVTFTREGLLFLGSLQASKTIHTNLINNVSRAKFRFFDSTPLGQIMNRFSKDIEQIDQEIAPVAVGVIYCLTTIVTIVVLISVITPGFLIAGIFIGTLCFLIGRFYISSSRDLKRLEAVQRSPLYQQFGETLSGVTTIRAYGDERRFIRDNLNQVNTHNRPFIYLWGANRWLAYRVDIVGSLVSFFAGAFVVLSVGKIDAGAAGLSMTYAVTFTEHILWFVRLYSMNEQNMNSVERLKEYLDVEQEAAAIVEDNRPKGDWPSQGSVEFVNYSTRYRKDFDLVLRDLTFKINPCEKIGVVGRTGAGKSSLAMALFRAIEAEQGLILVDGIDISLIGLQNLRESIVMVPQDPTLFSGTIRSNLDPFGLFTDEEMSNSLRRVHLIGAAPTNTPTPSGTRPTTPTPELLLNGNSLLSAIGTSKPGTATPSTPTTGENKNIFFNLSSTIAESGSNLSQGQRQLLCLARALLKEPKILLMDEATASIDYATDSKVQETIRELKSNTIITIAHRLKTIVDYDRVVVMERGRVVEIGAPWELLRTDGKGKTGDDGKRWFREMCETSGELEILEQEAKKSWESKRLVDDDE